MSSTEFVEPSPPPKKNKIPGYTTDGSYIEPPSNVGICITENHNTEQNNRMENFFLKELIKISENNVTLKSKQALGHKSLPFSKRN